MPKKECCCPDVCQWCDHDHYAINYTGLGAPYDYPDLRTSAQPNWNAIGTVTTELPSVGHPMTLFTSCPGGITLLTPPFSGGGSPGGGLPPPDCFTEITPCIIPAYNIISECAGLSRVSLLRTPITNLDTTSTLWGNALRYGDIQPCWFNGLNMTNIRQNPGSTADPKIKDEDIFFNFTFELKIEKEISGASGIYETIVDIKKTGPGINLRPHPDACRSYNVNDHAEWFLRSECDAFSFEAGFNDEGEVLPCFRDFAKMPRGPWPYRLQRKLQFASGNTCCQNLGGGEYTVYDVLRVQKDPTLIGTTGECGAILGSNLLCCELEEVDCSPNDPDCCSGSPYLYMSNKDICNRLDISEGTPYGWEDVPPRCPKMANYEESLGKRKFFGWLNKFNRYTTPEWDFYEKLTSATGYTGPTQYSDNSNKISLHVLVPTAWAPFCDPDGSAVDANGQGLGFGEWSFGMDYESPDAIGALETAGYVWSNSSEDDGIWINKTPTNALRVLFTLDHADLGQGKVWRVFRDWDVQVTNKEKVFGSQKFRISLKQIVEEVQFSSLGCDCPSGYTIDENGVLVAREEACDIHYHENYFGNIVEDEPELPCWQSTYDGPYMPGRYEQTQTFGARISFSERGPIALKAKFTSYDTGCQICSKPINDSPPYECDAKFGTKPDETNDALVYGQLYIINGPTTSRTNEIFHPDFGSWPDAAPPGIPGHITECWLGAVGDGCLPAPIGFDITSGNYLTARDILEQYGTRYNGAIADIPWAGGRIGSVATMRYRNVYNSIQTSPTARQLVGYNFPGSGTLPWGTYEMLYGSYHCNWTNNGNCPLGNSSPEFRQGHEFSGVYIDPWPAKARLGNCKINCQICGARDNTTVVLGGSTYIDPGSTAFGPGTITWSGGPGGGNPSDPCPCELGASPPSSNPEQYGPFLYPYDTCAANINRPEGYGDSDFWYDCNPVLHAGDVGWYCYYPELPENVTTYMGLDSDRFYFSNDGQVSVRSGIGDLQCAATCTCPNSSGNNTGNCRYTVTDPNTGGTIEYCDFCLGSGQSVWAGFPRNSFYSWRRSVCNDRKNGIIISPDYFYSFTSSCNSGGPCPPEPSNQDNSCNLFFAKRGPCDLNSGDNPGNGTYSEYICSQKVNLPSFNPTYSISFSSFDLDSLNQMCTWDTTYEPNPGRNNLPSNKNRSHIVINAKGLFPP